MATVVQLFPEAPIATPRRPEPVAPGRNVEAKERMQWQAAMASDRSLNARAREIATRLAVRYADKKGVAWPSRELLAADLGISVATVKRAIARLQAGGWIRVLSGRVGVTNRYTLSWPAVDKAGDASQK